jgi:hypothetical protein
LFAGAASGASSCPSFAALTLHNTPETGGIPRADVK